MIIIKFMEEIMKIYYNMKVTIRVTKVSNWKS